jgi:hypothetical protein
MRQALFIAGILIGTTLMQAQVKIEPVAWEGWPNCYRLTNGEVELIVTSDIGPRVMRYGYVGGTNMFWVQKETAGKSGEPAWVLRGGHRIWIGPEDIRYTYPPDNAPIKVTIRDGALVATQPVERETNVEKQIEVRLAPKGTQATVIHRLRNRGNMPLEFSAWALSMMAPGGLGITGFPPRGTHPEVLPPTNPLVMWAFTDLTDPRWKFTKKYLTLKQDPAQTSPQKLGHFNSKTFGAYLLGDTLFMKHYLPPGKAQDHPDFGTSFQIFANGDFLELETMGPLTRVGAGETLEHVETWQLRKGARLGAITDAAVDALLAGLLP